MNATAKKWDITNWLSRTIIDALEEQDVVDCEFIKSVVKAGGGDSVLTVMLDGLIFDLKFKIYDPISKEKAAQSAVTDERRN